MLFANISKAIAALLLIAGAIITLGTTQLPDDNFLSLGAFRADGPTGSEQAGLYGYGWPMIVSSLMLGIVSEISTSLTHL